MVIDNDTKDKSKWDEVLQLMLAGSSIINHWFLVVGSTANKPSTSYLPYINRLFNESSVK